MSYNVVVAGSFKREAKRLKKRHKSLNADVAKLVSLLESDPMQGTALGNNCYKIRVAITSKGKGKRGGARVITYVQVVETTVYLLTIYDKTDVATLTDADIQQLLDGLNDELTDQ